MRNEKKRNWRQGSGEGSKIEVEKMRRWEVRKLKAQGSKLKAGKIEVEKMGS